MRQGLRLEPLLQAISDFLDDQNDMIEQVRCDLTRGLKNAETGRSGLTPQQVLRSLVLMRIKNWNYREIRMLLPIWQRTSLRLGMHRASRCVHANNCCGL